MWDLTLLGVDPSTKSKGTGKELVAWGFARAKEEGVGCSVMAAGGVEPFYQKCGFDVVAGRVRDHGRQQNPLIRENISGGTMIFCDNVRDISGVKKYGQE